MTNVDSQRIKEIRDYTRAMAEAFGRIADTLAEALELYVSTQTETQNSNLTFEIAEQTCENCNRTGIDPCFSCDANPYIPKTEPQTERGKLINDVVKLDMSREDKFKVIELIERHCEKCKHYLFTDIDGYYCEHETYGQPCHYEPKDEQTEVKGSERWLKSSEQSDAPILTASGWKRIKEAMPECRLVLFDNDGNYIEPQTDNGTGCSKCESRHDCYDRDLPHAIHCNNYDKVTDCSWK